jgi:hypothetical protein
METPPWGDGLYVSFRRRYVDDLPALLSLRKLKGKYMPQEVHLTPVPGTSVVFHQPGQVPLATGAGQPVTVVRDSSGKVLSTSGQVTGTSVIHRNPS